MSPGKSILLMSALVPWLLALSACGKKTAQDPQERKVSAALEESHAEEGEGASFAEGKGIALSEETSRSIGLELTEVGEQTLQPALNVAAQIYRSAGESSREHGRERSGHAYATVLVTPEAAAQMAPGTKVRVHPRSEGGEDGLDGTVWRIDRTQVPILGRAELLLQLSDPGSLLRVGDFVEASVRSEAEPRKAVSIPRSAVLHTSSGAYAFVQNGDFLLRTEIRTGAETPDQVEIAEGLYEGDTVAVNPVETLYLIELRATKGGGHCH